MLNSSHLFLLKIWDEKFPPKQNSIIVEWFSRLNMEDHQELRRIATGEEHKPKTGLQKIGFFV